MNETTRTHLKTIVERAVRPVRISTARKLKMREELLAHVCAVFEEETERPGDDGSALRRTEQRFGDPAELTVQLQSSCPPRDFSERFMDRVVLLTVFWFVLFGGAQFPTFSGRILLEICLFGAGFIFLGDLLRLALNGSMGRTARQALVIAAASFLLFLGLLFLLHEYLFDQWSQPRDISNIFMVTAALTWGLVTPVHATIASLRSQVEWESLPIE